MTFWANVGFFLQPTAMPDVDCGGAVSGFRSNSGMINRLGDQMHQITFYPVGNGDSSQIVLENGKRLMFDFRHLKLAEEGNGPEIDLKKRLRSELFEANRDYFDVLAFTHCDSDHINNSTEFFELLHAAKYQGADRIKIRELWVPAAMIIEEATNDQQSNEFVVWRQEARYRLKEGKGIQVFSRPDKLKVWLEKEGIKLEDRQNLITDAGKHAKGLTRLADGVEFFCHSPYIKHVDEGDDLRNDASLIFNVRFNAGNDVVDYLAVGDSTWQVLEDIVRTTKAHDNDDRLAWDLFNIPHHCSYLALSDEKGDTETEPKPLIKELLLAGKANAFIVSSSDPITDTYASRQQTRPPHVQAKKCYERYLNEVDGRSFVVVMSEPNAFKPEPIVFNIDVSGLRRKMAIAAPTILITNKPAPRAGNGRI